MLSYLSRDIQWRKINDISAFVFLGSILLNNASLMIFLLCCSTLVALMLVFVGRRLFGSHELRFDAPRQDARAQQVATVISQQGFSLVRNGLLPLNVQSISQTFSRYCNEMKGHNSKLTNSDFRKSKSLKNYSVIRFTVLSCLLKIVNFA